MELERINIFWTGGWDSTFRILQLSNKPITIQPYYLKDNRHSESLEISTIKSLTEEIMNLDSTRCEIKELISLPVTEIDDDIEVTQAYKKIRRDFKLSSKGQKLGTQYEYLARFSKNIDNIELCVEKGTKPVNLINTFGELQQNKSSTVGENYSLNKEKSSDDLVKVFGNYHYPIVNLSKLEMKQFAEENEFIHILNKTWFCFNPRKDQPCGRCSPCMQTIEAGLTYRFNKIAFVRYAIEKSSMKLRKLFG